MRRHQTSCEEMEKGMRSSRVRSLLIVRSPRKTIEIGSASGWQPEKQGKRKFALQNKHKKRELNLWEYIVNRELVNSFVWPPEELECNNLKVVREQLEWKVETRLLLLFQEMQIRNDLRKHLGFLHYHPFERREREKLECRTKWSSNNYLLGSIVPSNNERGRV